MIDSSKLPIGRVDVLDNKLSDIDTTIINNYNETNIKIDNVNEDLLEIIDGLTNRIQTLEARRYVTTYWKSGTSWYRIWSDGFIEQGGRVTKTGSSGTITFPKPFTTTNYSIATIEGDKPTAEESGTDTGGFDMNMGLTNFTKSTVRYSCASSRCISYIACGY